MDRFEISNTPISGVRLLRRRLVTDSRGVLSRLYDAEEMTALGAAGPVAQVNHSVTHRRGVVRGLHFQRPPYAEMKWITCLRGEIFDVAVDLRAGSDTFLKWHGVHLSADDPVSYCIPEGCAHGFQVLSDGCELLYLHTAPYRPDAEGGLHVRDPRLDIAWPLPVAELSVRDQGHLFLDAGFGGLSL